MTRTNLAWLAASLALVASLVIAPGCSADSVFDGGDPGDTATTSKTAYTGPRKRTAYGKNVRCFESFGKFKRAMIRERRAATGDQKQWHHIVAQHPDNKKKFGESELHCTDNLTYLRDADHRTVNSYYSTQQKTLGNKSFRDWLKPKDFHEQYVHGKNALDQLGIEWTLPLD